MQAGIIADSEFVTAFRQQAEEAMFLRSRAAPGEYVELEIRLQNKRRRPGVTQLQWYNSYNALNTEANERRQLMEAKGYITEGKKDFVLPPRPRGVRVIESRDRGDESTFASPYIQKPAEYPYKFRTHGNDPAAPWFGPIIKISSQYVSHSVPVGGGANDRLQITPGSNTEPTWQRKYTNYNAVYDAPDRWMRIAVSSEAPTHAPLSTENVTTRYISRHSFIIDNARVDFSKVYMDGELSREIEIEYIFGTGMDDIPFLTVVDKVLRSMFETPLLFSRTELKIMSAVVNKEMSQGFHQQLIERDTVDRTLLADARTLEMWMLNSAYLFGTGENNSRSYNVTPKIDGFHMIWINDPKYGTWLTYPPYQAQFFGITPEHKDTRLTVFEGEVNRGNFWFIDAMIVNGVNLRVGYTQTARRRLFFEWFESAPDEVFYNMPPICKKPSVPISKVMDGTDPFLTMEDVYIKRNTLSPVADTDGLILTPDWAWYNDACSPDPRKRIIYKWKPDVTTDLVVRRNQQGGVDLFTEDASRNAVQFRGTSDIPFVGRVIMGSIPIIDGSVVEFRYERGDLIAYKLRLEKAGPNSLDVVEGNWRASIADGENEGESINEADLLCRTAALMRKSHNRIKDRLIRMGGGVALDIGIGKLGDITKYYDAGYDKVLGIDPYVIPGDYERAQDRLSKTKEQVRSKIKLMRLGGDETNAVIDFVNRETNNEGVDTIVLFDSLTFFDKSMLRALAATIKGCLKKDGVIIWRCMYGSEARRMMSVLGSNKVTFYNDYLEYLPEENMIHVEIHPNISQNEYIVNMQEFLDLTGLVYNSKPENATDELLLSERYRSFSSLFYHGILTYLGAVFFPPELQKVFGSYTSNRKPIPASTLIESIESLFTNQKHTALIDKYWELALTPDLSYATKSSYEPDIIMFETAGDAYFTGVYLSSVADLASTGKVLTEKEIFATQPTKETEMDRSLAFAYLLGINVFVVSGETGKTIYTNAIPDTLHKPCLIVVYKDDKYSIEKARPSMPFYRYDEMNIDRMVLQKRDLREIAVVCKMDEAKITRPVIATTNTLYRVAFADTIPTLVRLDCLANTLLLRKKNKCDSSDIEKVGVEATGEAVRYTNTKITELNARQR